MTYSMLIHVARKAGWSVHLRHGGHLCWRAPGGGAQVFSASSPSDWRHVHLTGRFDFSATASPIDLDALTARYADPEIWHRSLQEEDGEEPES